MSESAILMEAGLVPSGMMVRDAAGDYSVRIHDQGHLAFAVGTREWCSWGSRATFPWRRVRGRVELVRGGFTPSSATAEALHAAAVEHELRFGQVTDTSADYVVDAVVVDRE